MTPSHITSRDNPLLKELRKLVSDSTGYRRQGRVWVEGEHLCEAALKRAIVPEIALFSESKWQSSLAIYARKAAKTIVLTDRLFAELTTLESPAGVGFVIGTPESAIDPAAMSVILDRVQDAGNVGSILRSAAAFGYGQILAIKGTAALWSPKVLRAGMGAHFGLSLVEGLDLADLDALEVPLVATSSHVGALAHEQLFPRPCAWVLGHEGQGVGAELLARARLTVRIAQPGGEESLNVAAAAAICLHASSTQTALKL